MQGAGFRIPDRHSHTPDTACAGSENAGTMSDKSTSKLCVMCMPVTNQLKLCMQVDKNKIKCQVPVAEPAQPHTGPGVCRFGECWVKIN
jgi:molybdenum cofactor biosynthesis enzyme